MRLGVAYYPEFYNPKLWQKDVDDIAQLGFTVVRMAEFAWCRLEPVQGEYEFAWLDDIIEKFAEKGVKTILGTPTGAPPQWIVNKYPDLPIVDDKENPNRILGGFGNFCKNHPGYREHSARIAGVMAEHYKNNDNVILYQIDNEFMGEPCYCKHCTAAFVEWLKKKHKTIEKFNETMFSVFQGREFKSFDEIQPLATRNMLSINPSILLEYKKFISDTFVDYCSLQVQAIRAQDPDVEITTNYNTLFTEYDHYEMGKLFDVAGCDTYPKADNDCSLRNAMKLDLCRSVKKKNFWILEQQCSPAAFRPYNYTLEPGEARLFTYKSIAHGADGIVYFRWNSNHTGGERFGAGLLRHDGTHGRTYREIKQTCDELKRLASLLKGSKTPVSKVAIVYSNLSCWALCEGRKITQDMDYLPQVRALYHALRLKNIDVDFVNFGDDLNDYQVVFAPAMAVVRKQDASWYSEYVAQGGNCVFGLGSGMLNEYATISSNYYQGELRELLGIRVTEWAVPYQDKPSCFEYKNKQYPATLLNMIVELETASAIGEYKTGFYKGTPAVTVNSFGKGKAYYWATMSNADFVGDFTSNCFDVLPNYGIKSDWVDVKVRENNGKYLYILMNHKDVPQQVTLQKPYCDALTAQQMPESFIIEPFDVRLLCKINTK